jgi:uncharacterized protein YoxC
MYSGDIIFQIFMILIPLGVIALIIFFIHSLKKRNKQLNRIEENINKSSTENKK